MKETEQVYALTQLNPLDFRSSPIFAKRHSEKLTLGTFQDWSVKLPAEAAWVNIFD